MIFIMPDKSWRRKAGSGDALAVLSADDWERERETLYVLQNDSLMKQIADPMVTHNTRVADQENRSN